MEGCKMSDFLKLVFLIFGVFLIVFSLSGFLGIQMGASSWTSITYNTSPADNHTAVVPSKLATSHPTVVQNQTAIVATATAKLESAATPTTITIPTATMALGTATAVPNPPYYPFPTPGYDGGGGSLSILGVHTVRANEYLYCIGRAYGVLPQAIAEASSISLNSIIFIGQELMIPDMPWVDMMPGPTCIPQFSSPYSLTPTPTTLAGITSDKNQNNANHFKAGKDHTIKFVFPKESMEGTDLQSISPIVMTTPDPPTAETRIVQVVLPKQMHVGESSQVKLTFNPETGQSTILVTTSAPGTPALATNTPDSLRTEQTSGPVKIPDVFDKYRIFADARLDAAGFNYSPHENIEQEIVLDRDLTWRWSIKPQDADAQALIISLRLVFKPRTEEIPPRPDQEVWSDAFPIDVTRNMFQNLFGAQANFFAAFSLISGCIISLFSIWDKIPWRKKTTEKIYSSV